MVTTALMPARKTMSACCFGIIFTRTGMRCTTLVKLPVALSGGSGVIEWLASALFSGIVGLVLGAAIAFVVHKLFGAHATHGGEDDTGHCPGHSDT